MEEFGSRIQHSDAPSVAMVPFFHILTQMSYSVMWPTQDLQYGGAAHYSLYVLLYLSSADDVTRNRVPSSAQSELDRICHALPWSPRTLSDPCWEQLSSYHALENMPDHASENLPEVSPPPPSCAYPLTVYTDIDLVFRHLNHAHFKLVTKQEEADIIWQYDHFKDFKWVVPHYG